MGFRKFADAESYEALKVEDAPIDPKKVAKDSPAEDEVTTEPAATIPEPK